MKRTSGEVSQKEKILLRKAPEVKSRKKIGLCYAKVLFVKSLLQKYLKSVEEMK